MPTPTAENGSGSAEELEPVKLILDWQPNTNHTGLFVARDEGYFEAAGLAVEIIQPGEVYAEQAVAGGAADFGISFQEALTLARVDGVPLVSVAAIVQHNSSGFAARADLAVAGPADYAGLRYGTFGTPFEQPTIAALMACDGADEAAIASLQSVDIGYADPLALLAAERIDLAWIFRGWQGIQAEREGLDLDMSMLEDSQDCIPDYYTPVLMTREDLIAGQPAMVARFVAAVAAGYRFAIERPAEAAEILLAAAPELDRGLVIESQSWLSPRYQDDAPRWGEQRGAVWRAYADWMLDRGIIESPLDAEAAFSNAFLP
jgi:ABC-type nitrate/sulfonate/bicarbonate transport system substrate-binding protein